VVVAANFLAVAARMSLVTFLGIYFVQKAGIEVATVGLAFLAENLARGLLAFPLRIVWSIVKYGGWRDGWRGLFVAWQSARYRVVVRLEALRRA